MRTDILGVKFDTYSLNEAKEKAMSLLNLNKKSMIFTPNPEFVLKAREDKDFLKILNKGTLVIPDGIGIVYASKILGGKIKERVPGADLVFALFDEIRHTQKTVYLLGAKPGVAQKAKKNMEKNFPGLKIVGVHHGYFDKNSESDIISEINRLKTDFLIVGLGVKKQEEWIYKNRNKLNCRLFIGSGGLIDVFGGTVKRAPRLFQKLGVEWLYRLIKEPKRIKRQVFIPLFMGIVIKKRIFKR